VLYQFSGSNNNKTTLFSFFFQCPLTNVKGHVTLYTSLITEEKMINKKFQSFMLATIALALCVLAGDKIYDALIPEARANAFTWVCGKIDHREDAFQRQLNQHNVLQVSLVKDVDGRSIYTCFAF